MSIVIEVKKLVVPLCNDAQGVFEEGDDDQKASNGG